MSQKCDKGNVPKEVNMWETLRKEEVVKKLKTNVRNGLDDEEIIFRQSKYGKNKIKDREK